MSIQDFLKLLLRETKILKDTLRNGEKETKLLQATMGQKNPLSDARKKLKVFWLTYAIYKNKKF